MSPSVTEATPVLHENARAPAHRFEPETYDQFLTSVYVLWNLLDRIIQRHRHRPRPAMPYGYMRLVQLHGYSRLAWKRDDVRTYCETGVNGGHGTAAMLLANPNLVAYSFDEGIQPYSQDVFDTLKLYFGERFNLYVGNSHKLLPEFATNASHRQMCDVILIDGDHSDGAYLDIRDFKPLAACHAHVLLDDTLPTSFGANAGPRNAIARAQKEGLLHVVRNHGYNRTTRDNPCLRDKFGGRPHCFNPWGWAIGRYGHMGTQCNAESAGQAALRAQLELET